MSLLCYYVLLCVLFLSETSIDHVCASSFTIAQKKCFSIFWLLLMLLLCHQPSFSREPRKRSHAKSTAAEIPFPRMQQWANSFQLTVAFLADSGPDAVNVITHNFCCCCCCFSCFISGFILGFCLLVVWFHFQTAFSCLTSIKAHAHSLSFRTVRLHHPNLDAPRKVCLRVSSLSPSPSSTYHLICIILFFLFCP